MGFLDIFKKKSVNGYSATNRGGWWPVIRESFSGAWQQNVELKLDGVLRAPVLFRCISMISSDIGKMNIRVVRKDEDGIWKEIDHRYNELLRRPNRYQNRIQFFTAWPESKMKTGNAVILKERNNRGEVVGLHVLDWGFVTPLVTESGDVYYQLTRDDLSGVGMEGVTVPASEIIHDRWNTLFHPLVGLSPIYACGLDAAQNVAIRKNSSNFFSNGARPGGILTAPGAISDETAERLKAHWNSNFTGENAGKVAVLGDGLKYEAMIMKSTDAQLVEQLKLTDEHICIAYGVPGFKLGVGSNPSYENGAVLDRQYYSQCLQVHIESVEMCLDDGLGFTGNEGTEFDLEDLMRLDTKTQMAVLKESDGIMQLNEQRKRLNLPPVVGGDTVYKQQQEYSVEALSKRDALPDPFNPSAETNQEPEPDTPSEEERSISNEATLALFQKQLKEALYA